jgi:hypothetical protein
VYFVSGSTWAVATSSLSLGAHLITAVYSGDANFAGSTSSALLQMVVPTQAGSKIPTTTMLVSSSNPASANSPLTLTATVTPASAAVAAAMASQNDYVDFFDTTTNTDLGKELVNASGAATLANAAVPCGTNVITASLAGDQYYAPSSATITQLVGTLIVTSADDPAGYLEPNTLRWAIAQANTGAAAGYSQTIVFNLSLMAPYSSGSNVTITLGGGEGYSPLEFTKGAGTVTIDGNGQVAVVGDQSAGDFAVDSGAHVVLTGLTIEDGEATSGGGILNDGNLTVRNCTIADNSAYFGGGIYSNSPLLTLTDDTFAYNAATAGSVGYGHGGALDNAAGSTLAATNCTFYGNTAALQGGGIYNSGATTLVACTITGNTANYGGAAAGNGANIGGGIYNNSGGTLSLGDTIVAGNSVAAGGKTGVDISGSVAAAGSAYNLVGPTAGETGLSTAAGYDNVLNVNNPGLGPLTSFNAPGIGPLANFGGGLWVIPLMPGSPAIGAGVATVNAQTDELGEPLASPPDIGACQSVAVDHFTVTLGNPAPTAGVGFPVTITAKSASGATVDYNGPVTLTSTDGQPVNPSTGLGPTTANGTVMLAGGACTTTVTLDNATASGTTTKLKAVAGGASGLSPSFALGQQIPDHFQVIIYTSGASRAIVAGQPFGVSIEAEGAIGCPCYGDSATVSLAAGQTLYGLTNSSVTLTNGYGYAPAASLHQATTSGTLVVAQGSAKGQASFTVVAGPLYQMTVTAKTLSAGSGSQPYVTAGVPFTLSASCADHYGNPVNASGVLQGSVNVTCSDKNQTITQPGFTVNSSQPSQMTEQITMALVETSPITLKVVATTVSQNGQTLGVSYTSPPSNAFTVHVGAPAAVKFVQQPTNVVAPNFFRPAVTVAITDSAGNVVTSDNSDQVTLSVFPGDDPDGGAAFGGLTVMAQAGIATFNSFSIDKTGSNYALVATLDTPSAPQSQPSSLFNVTSKAVWTVLLYMDADNNLELGEEEALDEIAAVGSTTQVNFVAQFTCSAADQSANKDQLPWSGSRYARIVADGHTAATDAGVGEFPSSSSLGQVDMGSQTTLTNFINWGVRSYPAKYYLLDIFDHGGGIDGVCWDYDSGNNLSPAQVAGAIAATGTRMDVVTFSACMMGMVENAYELKDICGIMVASEEEMWTPWLQYYDLCSYLVKNYNSSPVAVAGVMVDTYPDTGGNCPTLSAVDLSVAGTEGIGALASDIDAFAQAAVAAQDWATINAARAAAPNYPLGGGWNYIDLGDFLYYVAAHTSSPALQNAAAVAYNQLDFGPWPTVIDNYSSQSERGCGLSIYIPTDPDSSGPGAWYSSDNFTFLNDEPDWLTFLLDYARACQQNGWTDARPASQTSAPAAANAPMPLLQGSPVGASLILAVPQSPALELAGAMPESQTAAGLPGAQTTALQVAAALPTPQTSASTQATGPTPESLAALDSLFASWPAGERQRLKLPLGRHNWNQLTDGLLAKGLP